MIIGIYGHQDAGKTTLLERLVKALTEKGYSVATVKHTPHEKSVDSEGKDTWRHWKAGADPVVFSSDIETAIIKHSKTPILETVRFLNTEFEPDIIVIEGFKEGPFRKVAVGDLKPTEGTVLRNPPLRRLVAYMEREVAVERVLRELPGLDCRKCGMDCEGLARAVVAGRRKLDACKELPDVDIAISIGGNKIATGRFASDVVNDTIRGMLSSLHGYDPGKDVDIRLRSRRPVRKGRPR